MEVPEGEKATEKSFEEIMTENLLNLMKYINLQIQEAQQTPSRIIKRYLLQDTL